MARTKKVGLSGKYGARYGRSVKKKVVAIESIKNKKISCPECLNNSVKRVASGIWECKKCGAKMAGKAYKLK